MRSSHEEERNAQKILLGQREGHHFENEGLNGRIRLRRNLLGFEDLEWINVIRVKD
jgi:hypothetical protein